MRDVTVLTEIHERAQRGICEARRHRKYCPPGPFTPVELAALQALADVERATAGLVKDGKPR